MGLSKTKSVKPKLDEWTSELRNIQKLSALQSNVIKLYDDYSSFVSKAKYRGKHGKRLKKLTSK